MVFNVAVFVIKYFLFHLTSHLLLETLLVIYNFFFFLFSINCFVYRQNHYLYYKHIHTHILSEIKFVFKNNFKQGQMFKWSILLHKKYRKKKGMMHVHKHVLGYEY